MFQTRLFIHQVGSCRLPLISYEYRVATDSQIFSHFERLPGIHNKRVKSPVSPEMYGLALVPEISRLVV
jgi:hypothetical protein